MAGRREQRERLRADREAGESRRADALARKRRLQYLIIAGFAAVAVIVAMIVNATAHIGMLRPATKYRSEVFAPRVA